MTIPQDLTTIKVLKQYQEEQKENDPELYPHPWSFPTSMGVPHELGPQHQRSYSLSTLDHPLPSIHNHTTELMEEAYDTFRY